LSWEGVKRINQIGIMQHIDYDEILEREQLHEAAYDGDLKKVKELVEKGFKVNVLDDDLSRTPLHCAVIEGYIEVAQYLLSVGADVNAQEKEKTGETPLGEVAANCSYEMTELLIKAGANPTIPRWMGISALDRASKRKKKEGVRVYELLLEIARKKFHGGE
jgi:ankyrin repeat protein